MKNLNEKIEAINTRNKFINEFVPKAQDIVRPYIENNKKLFLKDSSFIKKVHEEIYKLINELSSKSIRCYFRGGDYSKSFECDISYKTGEYGCDYLKHSIWFISNEGTLYDFKPLKDNYTVEEVLNSQTEIDKRLEAIKELEKEINNIKSLSRELL